ncbi:MAG: hypothetical protein VKJ02_19145 [Snowella sp.]|nr:hypothetical protein [Snowella sp.]
MASGCLFAIAILSAWAKFGRDTIAAKTLLSIPFYILWKIPLYFAFLVNRQSQWVRTERDMPLSQNSVASNRLFDKRLGYRETNQAFSSSASCFTSSLKPL